MLQYDSTKDTQEHIIRVSNILMMIVNTLLQRSILHDKTKLEDPEKQGFDIYSPKLKNSTYGSEEYKQFLEELSDTLSHHYCHNRHHPEFHTNGINDMNLIDLIEMLADWKAASERHSNGNIFKSIEINKTRFNIDPQLESIFINTINYLKL